jgi:hypothetical protein
MKRIKFLLKISITAFLCIFMLSCIDSTYDLSNLSKEAELFKNSLSAPVGTATIRIDSVIGTVDIDTSILSVSDNMYHFGYSGSFDMSSISNTFNNFALNSVNGIQNFVNLYDASAIPYIPFPLPATESKTYNGSMSLTLPSFNTNLINVDSVQLENTYLRLATSVYGLDGGNGKSLGKSVTVIFTAMGNAADYYDLKGNRITSWTLNLGDTSTVQVRMLRLYSGVNTLNLGRNITVTIANNGDIKATVKAQTYATFNMDFPGGVNYSTVWGKVKYTTQGKLDNIKFDAFGSILKQNDVLDLYDPTITLNTEGNLGVPVNINLNSIGASNSGGTTKYLTGANFRIRPAASPNDSIANTFVIDRSNGTSDLFKIAPDQILLGYSAASDSTVSSFMSKNSKLSMSYKMDIPLKFGKDLKMSLGTTLKNPFAGHMNMLQNQDSLQVALHLDIDNNIPLAFKIGLTALDKDSMPIASFDTVTTTTIASAHVNSSGFSTDTVATSTDISLTTNQINQIKNIEMFKIDFTIMTNPNAVSDYKATVRPSDAIKIKIGGKINGGVIVDLK